jgi:hypothetical protein
MSRCRSGVDEVSETLLAEDWERCGNSVQDAFNIDVDHLVPVFDAKIVERGNWHNPGIADENVELAVALGCQLDDVA